MQKQEMDVPWPLFTAGKVPFYSVIRTLGPKKRAGLPKSSKKREHMSRARLDLAPYRMQNERATTAPLPPYYNVGKNIIL